MHLKAFNTRSVNRGNYYNVWDYSGGKTTCIAFSIKANSKEQAIKKAKTQINKDK